MSNIQIPKWIGKINKKDIDEDQLEAFENIEVLITKLTDGNTTQGLQNLCNVATLESFTGSTMDLQETNKRGLHSPQSLMNQSQYFGNLDPFCLSTTIGDHVDFIKKIVNNDVDVSFYTTDQDQDATFVFNLNGEYKVKKVGFTYSPWDRNNCTGFKVTLINGDKKLEWGEVSVSRTTAQDLIEHIQEQTGCTVKDAIGELEPAIKASKDLQTAAQNMMYTNSPKQAPKIKELPNFPKRDQNYKRINQPTNDIDQLFKDAAEAQKQMKNLFAPNTEWAKSVLDKKWSVEQDKKNGKNKSNEFRSCSKGLSNGFELVQDPDIKSKERTVAKASFKQKDEKTGKVLWGNMRDLSRFALQFDNAEKLFNGVEKVKKLFKVVEIENRFKTPTPLGWADISMLVKAPVRDTQHIVELQLYLKSFANARKDAHHYQEQIRKILPERCEVPVDKLEEVQQCLLEGLVFGEQTHRGDPSTNQLATAMGTNLKNIDFKARKVQIDCFNVANEGFGGQRFQFFHIFGKS